MSILPFPKPPFFPLPDIGKILRNIGKVAKYTWSVITGKDEKQDEIANQKGLNPEKSDANEIAELNKLLVDYRQNIISAGNDIEREMIVECSMQMQDILELFEEYNKNLRVARTESVKRKFRHLNDELKGTFADYIGRRISLDDEECVKTLKLPAGDLKSQRLQELKQNVFIEAKNSMIEKIKYTVSDFLDTIEDSFNDHLDRIEEKVEDKKNAFEKLSVSSDSDAETTEKIMLQTSYIIALCSVAESI